MTTAEPVAATEPEPQAAPSTSPPKRKRRTFTLSDTAYDTLSAAALDGDGNRSGLLERYILDAATSIALDADAYAALASIAEVAEVEPARVVTDCIRRYDTSITLDADTYAALESQAAAYRTDPVRLVSELVERADAILAWTQPPPPLPWWQFWRRRRPATSPTPAALTGRPR